jgi:hypothetical protein
MSPEPPKIIQKRQPEMPPLKTENTYNDKIDGLQKYLASFLVESASKVDDRYDQLHS